MKSRALEITAASPGVRKVGRRLAILGTVAVLALAFVPWRQTIVAPGVVSVWNPDDRPQTIQAPIPARIARWLVRDGSSVRRGQPLVLLDDLDAKFLDPAQVARTRETRRLLAETVSRADARAARLDAQIVELRASQKASLDAAAQRIRQAGARRRAAAQVLAAADRGVEIARRVAVAQAKERRAQANDRVLQAAQAVRAAEQNETTASIQARRISELVTQGVRSRRDGELAENDRVKAATEVERAKLALAVSRRDASVGGLEEDRASIEVARAVAARESARAGLEVADRDVANASLEATKVRADTAAAMSGISAAIEGASETSAKNAAELQKLEIEASALGVRRGQRTIRAPRDGRVVGLSRIGAGQAVKPGDELAVILPTSDDRTVELTVSGDDVAFLVPEAPVRLQFAGFPALQFGASPRLALGTFGGRIRFISPTDDGNGTYRVVVRPDRQILVGGRHDPSWPVADRLRPGVKASGWILLREVPLGFELWRRFNGFPVNPPDTKGEAKGPGPIKFGGKGG